MAALQCPQCDRPASRAMGTAYCPECGWNRAAAEERTRVFLKLLPVLILVFDAPLILYVLMGHAQVPILGALALLAIVPAIIMRLIVRARMRLPR